MKLSALTPVLFAGAISAMLVAGCGDGSTSTVTEQQTTTVYMPGGTHAGGR